MLIVHTTIASFRLDSVTINVGMYASLDTTTTPFCSATTPCAVIFLAITNPVLINFELSILTSAYVCRIVDASGVVICLEGKRIALLSPVHQCLRFCECNSSCPVNQQNHRSACIRKRTTHVLASVSITLLTPDANNFLHH